MKFREKILSIFLVIVLLVTFIPMDIAADIFNRGSEIIRMSGNNENSNNIDENVNVQLPENQSEEKPQEEENNNSQEEDNKEEDKKPQEEANKPQEENDKEENSKPQEEADKNEQNDKLNWPSKPSWINHKPATLSLKSGQNKSDIYGIPNEEITNEDIEKAQEESQKEGNPVSRKKLNENDFNLKLDVYINGKKFDPTTDKDITVKEGQQFSFRVDWGPINLNEKINTGDYFEKKLFTVKGLQFTKEPKKMETVLVINGIYVGDLELTYKNNGEMNYKVIFNENINMFKKNSVHAYYEGSSSFKYDQNSSGEIEIWGNKATITITKNEVPIKPSIPGGTAWKPSLPSDFKYDIYGTAKDVVTVDRNKKIIEWRIIFVEKLQEIQKEFLDKNPIEKENNIYQKIGDIIDEIKYKTVLGIEKVKNKISRTGMKQEINSKGYVIVEDILDENQKFSFYGSNPRFDTNKKFSNSPFYVELPIMPVGTKNVINQDPDANKELRPFGMWEIDPHISGSKYRQVVTANEIKEEEKVANEKNRQLANNRLEVANDSLKESTVKNTPGTYTIIKKSRKNKRERLIINLGKMGDKSNEYLSFEHSSAPSGRDGYKERLQREIKYCEDKIGEVNTGQASPTHLLKARYNDLNNVFKKALENNKNGEDIKNKVIGFQNKFNEKIINSNIPTDESLSEENKKIIEELTTELTSLEGKLVIEENGNLIENNDKYQNFKVSLSNYKEDHEKYVEGKGNYIKVWNERKQIYRKTLDFYESNGVYGFVVKVRSRVINIAPKSHSNEAKITVDDRTYTANKKDDFKFTNGIIGEYSTGSVVIKKQDDSGNVLKGAKFEVFNKDKTKKAYFIDKSKSPQKDTYKFTHFDDIKSKEKILDSSEDNELDQLGDTHELEVNDKDGRLVLSDLLDEEYQIIEKESPKGYYLNQEPIKVTPNMEDVLIKDFKNISRSVKITKEDSFSGYGIAGAKFTLHKDDENGEVVTGFTQKTINGHTAYWYDGTGQENLETYFFEGNGNKAGLCIHGLEPGTYTIVEESPGDGYELDEKNKPKFTFKVEESKPQSGLDEQNHIVNDTKDALMTVKNDAKTAELSLTKIDGNINETDKKNNIIEKLKELVSKDGEGTSQKNGEILPEVGFALFGFKGNDKDWINGRKDVSKFEVIDPKNERFNNNGKYFNTNNKIEDVTVKIPESTLNGKTVKTIFTDGKGNINIKNIPRGYYILTEVKPANGYHVSIRNFYFKVDGKEEHISLYKDMNTSEKEDEILNKPFIHELEENVIKNFKRLLKIKLIKYEEGKPPTINGADDGSGNYPYGSTVNSENATLLKGAKYKLFYKPFENQDKKPDPEQLKPENADKLIENNPKFDKCVAYGITNEQGELDISEMTGKKADGSDGKLEGLHVGSYYLIETVAPKGFILDQTPIPFKLDEKLFEQNTNPNDKNIGILKLASNKRGKSSIKVIKEDIENKEKISGAEFIVKEKDTNKLLEVKEIKGKEGEYEVVKTDITPAPDTTNKEENIVQRIKEKFVSIFKGTEDNSVKNEIEGYEGIDNKHKLKTNKDGTFRLRGLVGHEDYILAEIKAPRGYKLPKENENEFRAPRSTHDEGAKEDKEEKLVYLEKVIENERLGGAKLSITKIDTDSQKPLKGAKFAIYKKISKNGDKEKSDTTDNEDTIDTSEYKKIKEIVVTEEETIVEIEEEHGWGDYYLKEIEAPNGYIIDPVVHKFTIERNSYNNDGNPIIFEFHNLENGRNGRRKIKIIKKDENGQFLPGVVFELYKKVKVKGEYKWVPYDQTKYITDSNGVIEIDDASYGQYKMVEVKSDDHIVDPKEIYFEVKKSHTDSEEHKLEMEFINFKNDDGGIPIYMRKSLNYNGGNTNFVIEDVEFNIFDNTEGKNPLYFREIKKGVYKYSRGPKDKKIDGQKITTNLVTDKNGEIRLLLPKEYLPKEGEKRTLYYKEVKAPEGVIIDESIKEIVIDKNSNNKWMDIEVQNEFNKEGSKGVKIEIQKVDDNNVPLAGAEFTLYKYPGDSEQQRIVSKSTDKDGIVVFEDNDFKEIGENGFVGGEIYTIKETKAPTDGYIRDQVILDIEIDKNAFEQNNGSVTSPIMSVRAVNSRYKGLLNLKKVDEKGNKALAGAEFKLYRKIVIEPRENIGNVKEDNPNTNPNSWHPYGYGTDKGTYVTNKNGVLEIKDLPLGEYYYEETKAPLGYKILPGSSGTFEVKKQNETHLHEINITVKNEEISGNKGSLELEKVNSKGEYLEGVEFKLYKREFYNGKEEPIEYGNNPYITDESGKITIDNIPIGNYYLEETKTLNGYVLPNKEDRKFYFDVTENTKDKIKFKVINKTPEEVIPPGPVDPDRPNPDPDKPDKPVDPDKPDKPDKPVDPDKPDKPDKPVDPDKPDKPDKPVDPNKPDKPDKPEDPNKPNKPDNPNDSGNSSKPNKPSIISKIPKTGDSAQLLATGAVFVGAGAGLFAIRRNNKKTITRSGRRSRKNRRKRK